MALLVWPEELPQKVREDGFERVRPDLVKTSRMAAGVHLTRPIATAGEQTLSCQIRVPRGLHKRFDRFFFDETERGSRPFVMRDQIYDGVELATPDGEPLLTPAGAPLAMSAWYLVRFTPGQPPRDAQSAGLYMRILFSLDILP